ncbi:MAG: DNA-binding response regulator [Crocinitomicaceae bacterium]|jgi:DNA-binding NarL/FixJ family response regulator|nr:DNA-binding response regulator [Crocinitomicaceae bacterium]
MEKINLAIADDHAMIMEGLSSILENEPNFQITQKAKNGKELIEQVLIAKVKPDIILMDIEMPIMNGFVASEQIVQLLPEIKIIYMTSHISKLHIEKAIATHANAYIPKDSNCETLIRAIKNVSVKGIHQNDYFNFNLIYEVIGKRKNTDLIGQLSSQEKEFIRLTCQEKDMEEIAKDMGIKISTARTYRQRILDKIGAKKTAGIIIYAFQKKLFQN